ncbi:hypothetical protein DXG01_001881 [Tephrocybe rancida]|nr:hypothetical protein DXG01_001881 [Tephrocybe rancida]
MEKRNREMRQSALPSSLIPHLYSRPQQGDISPSTAFPPPPLPPPGEEEADFLPACNELPSMRTTFAPPLPSVDTLRGPHYHNYEARRLPSTSTDTLSRYQTLSSVNASTLGIETTMGNLSLPSRSSHQSYGSPPFNDPPYQATHPERMFYGQHHSYLPPLPQESEQLHSSWREGEAGPSSLIHTRYEQGSSRGRRGSSQPVQAAKRDTYKHRGDISDDEGYRGEESYSGSTRRPTQGTSSELAPMGTLFLKWTRLAGNLYPSWSEPYQSPRSHSLHLGPDMGSRTGAGYPRYPLTSVDASHGGWSGTGGYSDHRSGYSPSSVSEASSDGRPDEEEESYPTVQKGKKRRRDSDVGDDDSRKNRKTAVACNFCRGRKLRCDGAKPACSNCMVRKFQCEYVPVQRRRGPGKKAKSKKGPTTGRSEASVPPERGSGLMPDANEMGMPMDMYAFQTLERSPPKRPSRQRAPHRTRSVSVGSETEKKY